MESQQKAIPLHLLRATLDDRHFLGQRLKSHVSLAAAYFHFKLFHYQKWFLDAEKADKEFIKKEQIELRQYVRANTTEARNKEALDLISNGWAEQRREKEYDFTSLTGILKDYVAPEEISKIVLSEQCCGYMHKENMNVCTFVLDPGKEYVDLEYTNAVKQLQIKKGDVLKILLYGENKEKAKEKLQRILTPQNLLKRCA